MDVKINPLVVGTIIAMAKVDAGKLHPWKRLGVAGGVMPLAAPSRGFGLALQLLFFEVGTLSGGLVSSAPE